MGTTPEGSRDLSRASDDAPSRPLSAVPESQESDDRPGTGTQPGTTPVPGPTGTQPGEFPLPPLSTFTGAPPEPNADDDDGDNGTDDGEPVVDEDEPPARTGLTLPGDPPVPGQFPTTPSLSDLFPPAAASVGLPDLFPSQPAVPPAVAPNPGTPRPSIPQAPRLGAPTETRPLPRIAVPGAKPVAPGLGGLGPAPGLGTLARPPMTATPGPAGPRPLGTQPGTAPSTGTQPGTAAAPRTSTQPGTAPAPSTGTQPGTTPAPSTGTQPGTTDMRPTSSQPGIATPAPRSGTQPGTIPAPRSGTQPGVPLPDGPTNTQAVIQTSRDADSMAWPNESGLMDSAELDDADLGDDVDVDGNQESTSDTDVDVSDDGGLDVSIEQDDADERDDEDDEGDISPSFGHDRPLPAARDVLIHPRHQADDDGFATSRGEPSRVEGKRLEASPSRDGQHRAESQPGDSGSAADSGTVSQSGTVSHGGTSTGASAATSHSSMQAGPISHGGSGSLAPRRDALFGQVLADRYRVLDLIGKGGMGKVYLAEHVALGKRVAVKVLNPAYTHRPDQVKRFLREAQAASKIGHENVIDVIDFGEMPNGSVFFAMEHLQGEDLGKLLRRSGALPWSRARRILLQICRALQAAHAKGILHRDMKPENVFIIHRNGMRDFVKVLDFGIAKVLEENRQVSHTLTQAGALIGTPEYMAPEQVQGEAGDVRMDIYALGCIMYQLLTGQLPFSDKTMFGVLSQQVNVRPVPPRQLMPSADIPPEVEAIILKAMEKDRALRFQTMSELIEGIVAAPRGTPDGRAGTTSNLDAAASAARIAAAMNAASAQALAASNASGTPPDASFSNMTVPFGSGSGQAAGPWPSAVRDPQLLTKLVIGLGAAVFVLLIGLVCALNRADSDGEVSATAAAVNPPESPETPEKPATPEPPEPPDVVTPKPIDPVVAPIVPTNPTPDPVVADDAGADPSGGDIILDDGPGPKKTTPKVSKTGTKTPKVEPLPAPTLERLDPFDQRKALAGIAKDVESCRAAQAAPRGSVAIVKIKVDGNTGRVLEATPADTTAAARCIGKVVKSKARFPRFKKTPQEFNFRFQM